MEENYRFDDCDYNYNSFFDEPDENDNSGIMNAKKKHIDLYSLAAARAMKRLRKSKNLGQGKAAVESNFSLSYLSNVERGNHAISLSKFMSFSDGINSNPEEICQLLCEEIAKSENESSD